MQICELVKDMQGNLIGYTLKVSETEKVFLSASACVELQGVISNAICINPQKGVFRAKDGFTIPTVVKREIVNSGQQYGRVKVELDKQIAGAEFVGLCRGLREAVRLNRVHVDTSKHNANKGYNTQYFKAIEVCGLTVEGFVLQYLMNMQPWTLARHGGSRGNDFVIIIDTGYRVNMYIKIKQDNTVIVSFHDDNVGGSHLKRSNLYDQGDKKYCYMLTNVDATKHDTPLYMSRGFSVFKFTTGYNVIAPDLVVCEVESLLMQLQRYTFEYIRNVYETVNGDCDLPKSLKVTDFDRALSFISYGGYTVSSLSFLIDIYGMLTSKVERRQMLTLVEVVINDESLIQDRIKYRDALIDIYAIKPKNLLYTTIINLLEG